MSKGVDEVRQMDGMESVNIKILIVEEESLELFHHFKV